LMVDFNIHDKGASGRVIQACMKNALQRYILMRKVGPDSKIIGIIADEYHNTANSGDALFLNECRSHYGFMFVLTQSIHNLLNVMSGSTAEAQYKALLTNFGTSIWNTVGDIETAKFASSIPGERDITRVNVTLKERASIYKQLRGEEDMSFSISRSREPIVKPEVFMHGLRAGGKSKCVDGIIMRTGIPWSNGASWQKITFKQP
jgi:hypothetical protein